MQDHEKTLLTLFIVGGLIGMSRLLVSSDPLSVRLIVGRTILGSATSSIAGVVLIQFPTLSPIALVAIACALGILGSTFIEEYLKKNVNKWGG
ncbi:MULTISPECIES: phage holin family protein [Acinetobacter]|uniref:holin n=1 Tax=Acinetobacter TaxID=469 RepID=UPI000806F090|nr:MULTISPECIES: holin [Acinetobacter]OBY75886.1 holin [Acinetobacter gyllenbergii]UUM27160.1 phage holin family protein [Acinetobacter colistiniresistens]